MWTRDNSRSTALPSVLSRLLYLSPLHPFKNARTLEKSLHISIPPLSASGLRFIFLRHFGISSALRVDEAP
jgi:hypothetical protein